MGETVISVRNVSKCFKRYTRPVDRLKEILLPGKPRAEIFWALQTINLEVGRGETLGILGQNGSGKSTLLQIIAGTLQPTIGEVVVRGRVAALLELGSGFNPEFTGRQNVFFNGRILGLSQVEIEARFNAIASFADIGDFIDQPVKTYSSGMFVRLAFAVAIHVNPDVLIIDEALAVGDGIFVHRCMAKIKEFQENGGTILFVSHDVEAVTRLCTRTAWLNAGALAALGEPTEIARQYQAWMYNQINTSRKEILEESTQTDAFETGIERFLAIPEAELVEANSSEVESVSIGITEALSEQLSTPPSQNPYVGKPYRNFSNVMRFGTGRAEIVESAVLDLHDQPIGFVYPGDKIRILVKVITFDTITNPIVGVLVHDHLRTVITGFNTDQLGQNLPSFGLNSNIELEFHLSWPEIKGGSYALEVAVVDGTQEDHEVLDWLQCVFSVISNVNRTTFGIVGLPQVNVSYRTYFKSESSSFA